MESCSLETGINITEEGTTKSAQPIEVIAALLAIRQTAKEGKEKSLYLLLCMKCLQCHSYMVIKMETY